MPTATTITVLGIVISVPSSVRNPARVPRASEFATTTVTDGPGTMVNSRHVAMYGKRIAELIIGDPVKGAKDHSWLRRATCISSLGARVEMRPFHRDAA